MGEDPTGQDDARTDPTPCHHDAARTCALPYGANSAAIERTPQQWSELRSNEDLLVDTFRPKWRRGNQTATDWLGVAIAPLRTIPNIAL